MDVTRFTCALWLLAGASLAQDAPAAREETATVPLVVQQQNGIGVVQRQVRPVVPTLVRGRNVVRVNGANITVAPVQQQAVRPRAVFQPGKPVIVQPAVRPVIERGGIIDGGAPIAFNGAVTFIDLPASTGPRTLMDFATSEIERMRKTCQLSEKQVRTLTVAAKGVVYREKRKFEAQREREVKPLVRGFRIDGFELHVDRTPIFRDQLGSHRIWTLAVRRVLTKAQLAKLGMKAAK